MLLNQDNLILLFDCNVYIILVIFCNGGAAGVWGSAGVFGVVSYVFYVFLIYVFDPGAAGVAGFGIIGYVLDAFLVPAGVAGDPGAAGVVIVWGFILVKLESLNKKYWYNINK